MRIRMSEVCLSTSISDEMEAKLIQGCVSLNQARKKAAGAEAALGGFAKARRRP